MIQKLFNTTVFRLSLVYALLFSTIAAGAMGVIYWMAEAEIKQQTDARLQLETSVLLNHYRTGAVEGLEQALRLRKSEGAHFFIYGLVQRQERDLTLDAKPDKTSDDRTQLFFTRPLGELLYLLPSAQVHDPARLLLTILPGGYQLLVGADLDEQHAMLQRLLTTILAAIATIFTLAIFGGSLMGYHVLRRINAVGATANAIINGNLHRRMPVTRKNDEFDRLSRVLNTMLERIEHLMQGMREVTDNLAHDLRNPLNRLRNRLEASQFHPPAQTDYPQVVQDTIQDVDDLIKTFNALLSIAQAESGIQRADWADVGLSALTDELAELYTAVAEEQGITLTHHAEPGLSIHGNRQLLAQAITNLLDNAVKYTPAGGQITLTAAQHNAQTTISVADNGPGIPADQRTQVFKRFARLDNARSTPGNGLGLSLVKAVAELHGAEIRLEDNQPGLRAVLVFGK